MIILLHIYSSQYKYAMEHVSSVLLWTGNQEKDRVLSRPGDPKQQYKRQIPLSDCCACWVKIYNKCYQICHA